MKKPIWLQKSVVMAMHAMCLQQHGGSVGIRDDGLLESALARPLHLFTDQDVDLCRLAAAYAAGIAKNHPFVDGNKRTAFLAAVVLLERNGVQFRADPAHAAVFVLGIAEGALDEESFAAWLRDNTKRVGRRRQGARKARARKK